MDELNKNINNNVNKEDTINNEVINNEVINNEVINKEVINKEVINNEVINSEEKGFVFVSEEQNVDNILPYVQKPNEIQNMNINNTENTYNSEKKEEPKKKKSHRWVSYVAVGVASSVLSVSILGAGLLYGLPNLNGFKNTPLYQSLSQSKLPYNLGVGGKSPIVQLATGEGGLSIVDIAKKVGPAVVGISTQSGMGSGIILSEDGYIITNYHVIQGAQTVKVTLNSKKEVSAKVVNYDQVRDLAVIKVTDSVKMPGIAEFGDSSSLQVGELAVAIGNPLGKDFLGTVTAGIISSANREINVENNTTMSFIQTDAAINPGNSGGALVNSKGQVIGINTVKISSQGIEGLGFAIPINDIKPKIDALLKPIIMIGISGKDVTKEISAQKGLPIGVYINDIEPFSAAEKAGLKSGDVIVKFGGDKISTIADLNTLKGKYKSGDIVKTDIVRNGKTITIQIQLSEN